MMDFDTAWASLTIGDTVTVSNSDPEPMARPDSMAMKVWRSHNFTGALVEKIDGAPRLLRFDLPADAQANVIGFAIAEDVPHDFDPA